MATRKTTSKPRARKAQSAADRNEALRMELLGVRAAAISAMAALQTRPGIDRELSVVLSRMAVRPLDKILAHLEGDAR